MTTSSADGAEQGPGSPATFFLESQHALRAAARLGPILDLACGRGRHALAVARAGLPSLGLDRSRSALVGLRRAAREAGVRVDCIAADLEAPGLTPPCIEGGFGAVLVFRYLHRPLCPWIERILAPGGLLVYETFTARQRALGFGPSNPDFLLEDGELPRLFPALETLHFEAGRSQDPRAPYTARLRARKPR